MKYLCLIYHNETAQDAGIQETWSCAEEMRAGDHVVDEHAHGLVEDVVTLRVHDGNVRVTVGADTSARERLGGYAVVDARDLNDAIRVAAKLPAARFGYIEVRRVKHLNGG